ncbi:hypothetical protein, partial [Desulfobacula sp.]|uniref:hypothetical protein n=1 Tax=Desulfobacula sp. TaxID=2593537 RepID=UPI0039B837B9
GSGGVSSQQNKTHYITGYKQGVSDTQSRPGLLLIWFLKIIKPIYLCPLTISYQLKKFVMFCKIFNEGLLPGKIILF